MRLTWLCYIGPTINKTLPKTMMKGVLHTANSPWTKAIRRRSGSIRDAKKQDPGIMILIWVVTGATRVQEPAILAVQPTATKNLSVRSKKKLQSSSTLTAVATNFVETAHASLGCAVAPGHAWLGCGGRFSGTVNQTCETSGFLKLTGSMTSILTRLTGWQCQ